MSNLKNMEGEEEIDVQKLSGMDNHKSPLGNDHRGRHEDADKDHEEDKDL